jgi:hypothetical protein
MSAADTDNEQPEPKSDKKIRLDKIKLINLGYVFLLVGILFIALSIDFSNQTIGLIGTSIIFWGALLIYFGPQKYVSKEVSLDTSLIYYRHINEMRKELDFKGRPLYFTPSNIFGLRNSVVILSKNEEFEYDIANISSYQPFSTQDQLVIIPPGQTLSEKIEDKLLTRFSSIEIIDFQSIIGKVIVDDLELAKNIHINIEETEIKVEINDSIFRSIFSENDQNEFYKYLGDPLTSAIACAISRSTHKPVIIDNILEMNNERKIIVSFKIIDIPNSTSTENTNQQS